MKPINRMEDIPLNEMEKTIMNKLVEAHNAFCNLQKADSNYVLMGVEWMNGIHICQDILINECIKREKGK